LAVRLVARNSWDVCMILVEPLLSSVFRGKSLRLGVSLRGILVLLPLACPSAVIFSFVFGVGLPPILWGGKRME